MIFGQKKTYRKLFCNRKEKENGKFHMGNHEISRFAFIS